MIEIKGTDVTNARQQYREQNKGEFPDTLNIPLKKLDDLRYGENPIQPAALYKMNGIEGSNIPNVTFESVKQGKQGLSATNLMDIARALDILKFFNYAKTECDTAVAVMKHAIPCGFAVDTKSDGKGDDLLGTYIRARDADIRSSFGGVVVLNNPLDKATAAEICSSFIECVAAPDYLAGSVEILEKKESLRVIKYSGIETMPKFGFHPTVGYYDLKVLPTGHVIAQRPYLTSLLTYQDAVLDPMIVKRKKDLQTGQETKIEYKIARLPEHEELSDLMISWYINLGVRSNGIVIVKDGVTLAIGSGQQERIGAVEQAITKAYQKALDRENFYDCKFRQQDAEFRPAPGGQSWQDMLTQLGKNPLKGAVLSSDAFFSDRDSIDVAGIIGIKAIIQPGGSIKDHEVIKAANEYNMAMVFTLERCFAHF